MNKKGLKLIALTIPFLCLGFSDTSASPTSTELLQAIAEYNVSRVEQLLDAGADINGHDEYGITPLMMCFLEDRLFQNVARLLINRGADVNAQSIRGRTALMYVAGKRLPHEYRTAIAQDAEFLISRGAEVNIQDNEGWTPLMFAANQGDIDTAFDLTVVLLRNRAAVNLETNNGRTALMLATRARHRDVAEYLIVAQANVDAQDNNGMTALMHAIDPGYTMPSVPRSVEAVVELLISCGANVNLRDNSGRTALALARERSLINETMAYLYSPVIRLLESASTQELDPERSEGER